jgi:hypothetical protein
MKIVKTEGCISHNITIDGVDLSEFGESKLSAYLFPKIKEGLDNGTVTIRSVIDLFQYDSYEYSDSSCETCGDSVTTTTWEI